MVEKKLGFSYLRDSGLNLNPQQDGLRISVPIPKVSITVAITTHRNCILSTVSWWVTSILWVFMLWKEVLWIGTSVHSFVFLFSVVVATIFIILFSVLRFSEKSSMIYIWFKPDPGQIMPSWQDPDLQHCWNVHLWLTDPSTDPDPDPASKSKKS